MTYRLACALVGAAVFSAACSPAEGDASGNDSEGSTGDGGSGDGNSAGDGDEVYLGTGAQSGAGGNILAGSGGGVGDGDIEGDRAGGGGEGDPPAQGSGGTLGGSGGAAPGTGGAADASGGTTSATDCTPNESGTFVAVGETVLDERTCLTWMRDNTTGDPYAEAVAYCEALVLGGYDDWRLPTAGEVATIFKCDGMWPPIDDTVFNVMGDGIWTSTETGTVAGDLPKVCGAGQSSGSYYDFGQVGGQNTRCVRGTSEVPDRSDCVTNSVICP